MILQILVPAPPDFQERNSLQESVSEADDYTKSENMSDVKVITPPDDPSHKSQTSDNEFDEFAEVESHNTSKDSHDVDETSKDGGQKPGENVVKEDDIEDFSPKTTLDSQQKPTCDILVSDANQSIEVQDEPSSDNSGEDNFEAFQNAPSGGGSGDDFTAFQEVQSDNSRTKNFEAFQEVPSGVNLGGDKFDAFQGAPSSDDVGGDDFAAFQDTPSGGDSGGDNWGCFW